MKTTTTKADAMIERAAKFFRANPNREYAAFQFGDYIHQFRRTEAGDIVPAGRWLAATGNEREFPSWDAGQ